MARISTARKRRRRKSYAIGIALLVACVTVVVVVTLFYRNLLDARVQVDPLTLCPVDGPNEIIAILVDSTDPFNGVQKDFLMKLFDEVEINLKIGTQVQIFSASAYSELAFSPMTNLCNPGDGSDISQWSGNPERVRKKWVTSFREPLNSALKSSIEATTADVSPLLSMIKAVSYKAFPATTSSIPKKLFIVSDMLEHTSSYSQYSESHNFEKVTQMPFYAHVMPNLRGVEVFVIYISRQGAEKLQTRRHAEFWSDYFAKVGASLQSIKRI